MKDYKYIVDLLSSVAALVAILAVLWSWFKSSQKALAIKSVVVHVSEPESTYILEIKNCKDYPVTIESIHCFKNPTYKVELKLKQPIYSAVLSLSESVFYSNETFEIGAGGHTDIKIKVSRKAENLKKALFSIKSSHGYHEIWCKKFLFVDMQTTSVIALKPIYETNSRSKALLKYFWLQLKHKLKC